MVHRIDLLAIAGRIVKRLAQRITNKGLEPTACVTKVDLSRVVGRSARSDEVRVVSKGNDSKLPVGKQRRATRGARQHSTERQRNPAERRTRAQHERVIRTNVDVVFAARAAALSRERQAQSRIARVGRYRGKQAVTLGAHIAYGQQIGVCELVFNREFIFFRIGKTVTVVKRRRTADRAKGAEEV